MTVRTDNLFIAHYQGSLLEEFHYYPFGMCFDVSKSPTLGKSAAIKYNSQLHEHDEFEDANGNVYGLEDYNFAFRNYDAQIGRWLQPDPLMQHPSPYLAMSNNPVSFTDPLGLFDGTIINSQGKIINQSGSHTNGYYVLDYAFGFGGSCVGDDAIKRSILFVYEITAYEFHTRNNDNRFLINQFRNRFMVSMDAGGNPRPLGEAYGDVAANYQKNQLAWGMSLKDGVWYKNSNVDFANNINTVKGVATGLIGGGYGFSSTNVYKYAQKYGSRTISAATLTKFNGLNALKMANLLGRANIVTGVIGSLYSGSRYLTDKLNGNEGRMRDLADALIGAGGTGVGVAATLGLVSNPIGWGVGIGVGIYFGGRFIYDLNHP
ncbi:MAG: hypothetical protein MH472_14400 [Bacteroidia bacterium]|nr:hypothetical protein [Bacteroidia bacterium]